MRPPRGRGGGGFRCRSEGGGGRGRGRGEGSRDGGRGHGGGRSDRGGGGGCGGGMKGGSKVIVERHHHDMAFVAKGKEDALVTKNVVTRELVYGEKRIAVHNKDETKVEYSVWIPFRSKLAAAILGGVDNIWTVTLEPFERDHACSVGGYRMPKKQKPAAA